MVVSLASISLGLHDASVQRMEDSPRDLVISSLGLEPSIENVHSSSYALDSDGVNFSAVMPLLTLIGSIVIPDQADAVEFLPGHPPNIIFNMDRREDIGVLGLIPELANDFMVDDSLIIRSERLEMNGWFEEEGDPFHYTGYSTDHFSSEILIDENIMERYSLEHGDIVYFIGPSGTPISSLRISGSVKTSLIGAGLTQELVSGIGILHLSELQYLTGYHIRSSSNGNRTDLANAIYIDLNKDRNGPDSINEVVIGLEQQFPGLKISSKENRIYRLEEEVLVLEVFSMGVGITTLFIGALFLSSIMVIDVEDRRGEIALMRAIGISRRTIYLQILKDSLLLSMLGAIVGLIPGSIGSGLLDRYLRSFYGVDMVFSKFTPGMVMISFLFLIIMVVTFSILPGIRSTSADLQVGLGSFNHR